MADSAQVEPLIQSCIVDGGGLLHLRADAAAVLSRLADRGHPAHGIDQCALELGRRLVGFARPLAVVGDLAGVSPVRRRHCSTIVSLAATNRSWGQAPARAGRDDF